MPAIATLLLPETTAHLAFVGMLLAASGYLAFTIARRSMHVFRARLEAFRFRTPEGNVDGWDYGQWLLTREHLLARLMPWRRRRILFPPSVMEADLRMGFAHRGDHLRFAEVTPEGLRTHDLVVPLTLPDLDGLRELEPLLARNPLPLPCQRCVDLCNDKLACNLALAAAGFADSIPEVSDSLSFPYVLKKRVDAWGENTHVVANNEDESKLAGLLHDSGYFRQDFVPGRNEYAAHIILRNGRIVAALTIEYVYTHDLHKKCREQPAHYKRLRRATHLRLFRDMLVAVGYDGLCCINYKLQDGRVRFLEINPRFGSSLAPWFFAMVGGLPLTTRLRANATTSAIRPRSA